MIRARWTIAGVAALTVALLTVASRAPHVEMHEYTLDLAAAGKDAK